MKILKVTNLNKTSESVLTLYHGTSDVNAEKIKAEGLKRRNLGSRWYTLADNFKDAKFHSNVGNGNPVVIEFKIPDTKDEHGLNKWVWNGERAGEGYWYSLREDLPSEFISGIHSL